MSIELVCEHCASTHQVNDRLAGRQVRCPSCDMNVMVPEPQMLEQAAATDWPQDETNEQDLVEVEAVEATAVVAQPIAAPPLALPGQSTLAAPVDDDDDEDDEPVLPRGNRPEEEMDMTPMVDVTFLLLIFFMVTAAFSLQKSIRMPRQQTDAPSTSVIEEESEDLDMVELEVDEFGSFLVMAPDWERETPGKQNLISALREARAGNDDGMRLAIKVHEMAKLRALVDAMDAGTIAGYAELEVTQVDQFD